MAHARRRPWLAASLSLLGSPGLGQLYNGKAAKAGMLLVGLPMVACLALWLATTLPVPRLNLLLPLTILVAVQVGAILDAARDARGLGDVPRPWYSRWYVLLTVWALNAFVVVPVWTEAVLGSVVRAFKIPTGGMERTVLVGDYLLANQTAYGLRVPFTSSTVLGARQPRRGDVIVFLFPEDRRRMFLKRVIGLPGETVEVRGRTVSIDGQPLSEPYALYAATRDATRGDYPAQHVPAGHLFVLGDNRDNSRDSRFWGFLPMTDVLSEATVVYFSREINRENRPSGRPAEPIRWDRIGRRLR